MNKNIEVLTHLTECKKLLEEHHMPYWDELPDIDLYMDQVIELVNKYLTLFRFFLGESVEITRPMINNYVKLGMMPAPVKKKYSRQHLAYILVICTLKQSLNISTIQLILPMNISMENIKYIYNSFVNNQKKAFSYVYDKLESVATPILKTEEYNPERIDDLIIQVASSANILKCLTEKIVGNQKSE